MHAKNLLKDDCKAKEYMGMKSLNDVRDIFRARTLMLEGIKGNHKNIYRDNDMQCVWCSMEVD